MIRTDATRYQETKAVPLLPSGRWQPDSEQSICNGVLRWCVKEFFCMFPRKAVPVAWHDLHQPAPPPRLAL